MRREKENDVIKKKEKMNMNLCTKMEEIKYHTIAEIAISHLPLIFALIAWYGRAWKAVGSGWTLSRVTIKQSP